MSKTAALACISVVLAGCSSQIESTETAPSCASAKSRASVGSTPRTDVLVEFDRSSVSAISSVDACGALFVAGNIDGSATFGTTELRTSSYAARYDASNELVWAKALPSKEGLVEGFHIGVAVATASGSNFVAGSFNSTFEAPGHAPLVATGNDPLVVRLSSEGEVVGAAQLEAEHHSLGWGVAGAVPTDDGGVALIGSGMASIRVGDVQVGKPGDDQAASTFIARFNEDLTVRWVKGFTGSSTNGVTFTGLSADPSGNFHATARAHNFDFGLGPSGPNVDSVALTFDEDGKVTALDPYQGADVFAPTADGSGRTFLVGATQTTDGTVEGQVEPANLSFVASHGASGSDWVTTAEHATLSGVVLSNGKLLVGGQTNDSGATLGGRLLGLTTQTSFTALLDEDGKFLRLGTFDQLGAPLPNGDFVVVETQHVGATSKAEIVATQFAP